MYVYASTSGRFFFFFFFNDTATTEIYTLSLHDALPICPVVCRAPVGSWTTDAAAAGAGRSEEHTSELQSLTNLVCRLLLEKKTNTQLPIFLFKKKKKTKKRKNKNICD